MRSQVQTGLRGEHAAEQGLLLVADDNEMNRDLLARRLSRRGFTVVTAADGQEALDRIAEKSFDLIVLDIMMPRVDGMEVLSRVREKTAAADLPIIMATAKSESQDVVRALEMGANDYVTKPLDFQVVLARVETQLSLKRAREELKSAHARMKADLEAAARVQQALLPVDLPSIPGASCAWRYRACDELAGDALNIFQVDDRHLCIYILDVSGHGVPASLLSVSVTRSLTLHADRSSLVRVPRDDGAGFRVAGAAEVASRLNVIYPMAGGSAGLYFTLCYGILDLATNRFTFVCAGHPGPVLLRSDGAAKSITNPAMPIGMFADAKYEETAVDLLPGDRLYLYSDGLTEETSPSGEEFGVTRLQAAIVQRQRLSLDENLDTLISDLTAWHGNDSFSDDITIAALEIHNH
ncbi:MAG: srrA 2 [Acidobacteria bacterium]|nr:srrA 2 [Acidobacteriota bacterium]